MLSERVFRRYGDGRSAGSKMQTLLDGRLSVRSKLYVRVKQLSCGCE